MGDSVGRPCETGNLQYSLCLDPLLLLNPVQIGLVADLQAIGPASESMVRPSTDLRQEQAASTSEAPDGEHDKQPWSADARKIR